MLWCALLLPDLALQVFTRGQHEPAPLAVLSPPPRIRVVAANPEAVACGVEPGLKRASALALIPELHLVERDPALESAALSSLAAWAGRFTPSISLDPPDAVLLELGASLRLFGGLDALSKLIRRGLQDLGFDGRLGFAPTPLAARWLARCGQSAPVLRLADLPPALAALPLSVLGDGGQLPADSLELLAGIGARNLGDVAQLPRSGLARRQAQAVMASLDRAWGRAPDPRPWFVPPQRYQARLPLPVPTGQVDTLLFALRRLLTGLEGWLEARHAGLEGFRLVLEYERNRHGHEECIPIILGALSRDMARCQRLAREHLGRLSLAAPVDALRLEADPPQPLAPERSDLFDGDQGAAGDPGLLLATLRARLGDDAVQCLATHADHRPEKAWRRHAPRLPEGATGTPPLPAGPRPLWLLPEPRPIPRPAPERLLAGPERIQSGWWDGADCGRDYYVVCKADHSLIWVFQDLAPPHAWYLHGYFG